jgi:hypothetical protein
MVVAPSEDRNHPRRRRSVSRARTRLGDYPVGVQTYPDPDPANMAGPMEIDLAIGLANDAERNELLQQLPRLITAERMRMEAAMLQPSLMMRLAEAAQLTDDTLPTMSDRQVADHLADQQWIHPALLAFAHLTSAADTRDAYHAAMQAAKAANTSATSASLT